MDIMQVEVEFSKKESSVKAKRPKDDAVIKLVLERVDRVFEKDIRGVNVVRQIFLKQLRQFAFEGVNDVVDL